MSKIFSLIFKFYINASIHVALAVYALFQIFVLTNHLNYDPIIANTIFLGTISAYNFVKFAPLAKLHHRSLTKNLRFIQIFSFLCFVGLLYYSFRLPMKTLITFISGTLLVIAYALPVVQKKNLRSIGKLKIYIVAFCWTLLIIVGPSIHYKLPLTSYKFTLEVLQLFVLTIALIIPFDIRDINYDSNSLQTIPQLLGITKAKYIACLLLVAYLLIDLQLHTFRFWIPSFIMVIVAITAVLKMPKKPINYYCSFGIESLPIIKLLVMLLTIRYF